MPHGRTNHGGSGRCGAWPDIPSASVAAWAGPSRATTLSSRSTRSSSGNDSNHLGTLGTGNHFIEVCLDEADRVWFMLHCGSRGVGNGWAATSSNWHAGHGERFINLPDEDLAYFPEGTEHFDDYVEAVEWAQDFAPLESRPMMAKVIAAGQIRRAFALGGDRGHELPSQLCRHASITSVRMCW